MSYGKCQLLLFAKVDDRKNSSIILIGITDRKAALQLLNVAIIKMYLYFRSILSSVEMSQKADRIFWQHEMNEITFRDFFFHIYYRPKSGQK
jgi:hypothetical protein